MNTYFRNTVPGSVLSKTTHLFYSMLRFHVREHFVPRLGPGAPAGARLQHIPRGRGPAASAPMKTPSADAVMSSRSYPQHARTRTTEVRVHRLELRVRLRRVAVFVRCARRRHRRRQRGDARQPWLSAPHRARLPQPCARDRGRRPNRWGTRGPRGAERARVAAPGRRATAARARDRRGSRASSDGCLPRNVIAAAGRRAPSPRARGAEPTRERVTRATRTASIAETPNMSCPS